MKARKIDVTNYPAAERQESGEPMTYQVAGSMAALLFHPELKLSALDTLAANKLAEKLEAADGAVLLDSTEYGRLKRAVDTFNGFTRNETELIRRVLEAPEVELEEKV